MPASIRLVYLSASAILVLASLVVAARGGFLPALDLDGLAEAVATLQQQEERGNQLDEEFQLITARGNAKKAVLKDLFGGQCDLRSAVARYQVQCNNKDWESLQRTYGDLHRSRDELVARHLICLTSQWTNATPAQRDEVEQRLKAEWARLRGDKVGQDV